MCCQRHNTVTPVRLLSIHAFVAQTFGKFLFSNLKYVFESKQFVIVTMSADIYKPWIIKLFFMLNSAEYEISITH